MKKTTLFISFFLAFALTACVSWQISSSMETAMNEYETWYETEYPNETLNVARECVQAPSGVFWSNEIKGYIVTCKIPNMPTVYGIVFMDKSSVSSTCTVNANTQYELEGLLYGLGYK